MIFFVAIHDIVIFFVAIHDKNITNHDIIFFFLFPKKKKITIRDILSWLDICLIKALRNPRRTNGVRRPVWEHDRLCFVCRL